MGYHLIFAACPLDFYIESNNRKLLISVLTNLTLARVVWQLLASEYSRRNSVSRTVVQINTLGAVCGRKARIGSGQSGGFPVRVHNRGKPCLSCRPNEPQWIIPQSH